MESLLQEREFECEEECHEMWWRGTQKRRKPVGKEMKIQLIDPWNEDIFVNWRSFGYISQLTTKNQLCQNADKLQPTLAECEF